MLTLEISSIASACGKNPFESRNKTFLTQLCKEKKEYYRSLFFEEEIFRITNSDNYYDTELKNKVKKHKVENPSDFLETEEAIMKEIISENPDVNTENLREKIKDSLKKECGKNIEPRVIKEKKYQRGNNIMYYYNDTNGWRLRGLHDATKGDMVIEVKTRMKLNNIRRNEYDLYQLFGYLLAMKKTKGKIVQSFNGVIYDSDEESGIEYGIIDIENEPWKSKFSAFYNELSSFFEEIKDCDFFDIYSVFTKGEIPIASFKDNTLVKFNHDYEKLIKLFL